MTEKEAIESLKCYRAQSGASYPEEIEEAIKALEEIQKYRAIGTPEECRAAVERHNERKPKEAARIWLKVKDVHVERLQEISEEQAEKEGCIDDMIHAIGLDYKKPYHRHGKAFYKPYRNRFYTYTDDSIWNQLHKEGLADRSGADEHGREWFWINRKGLDWLGNQLNITIYNEE